MCDTLAVVRADGVLFAKNSDRDPNEAQHLDWQPRRQSLTGARLRCTWIEIDEVEETYATLLSRPFWMWGAEIGANEKGVAIGNEAVFTRRPLAKAGLTGMDLLRLALERAATAREAVRVITSLLEEHGQGGGCGHEDRRFSYHNAFLVADPRGAFVLETAGREWALEEVRGARSISNGLTIPEFARKHADPLRGWFTRCSTRRARTEQAARAATSVGSLLPALRDHGEGRAWPSYGWDHGTLDVPCMHGGGAIATSQTTASWAAHLRPEGSSHWVTGTSSPCLSIFKPVRVLEPLDLGPAPSDRADARSLFWRHELLHRAVMRDPERLGPAIVSERDRVEARWLARPPEPVDAFAEADALLARWTAAVLVNRSADRRPWLVRRYWDERSRRAGLAAG